MRSVRAQVRRRRRHHHLVVSRAATKKRIIPLVLLPARAFYSRALLRNFCISTSAGKRRRGRDGGEASAAATTRSRGTGTGTGKQVSFLNREERGHDNESPAAFSHSSLSVHDSATIMRPFSDRPSLALDAIKTDVPLCKLDSTHPISSGDE